VRSKSIAILFLALLLALAPPWTSQAAAEGEIFVGNLSGANGWVGAYSTSGATINSALVTEETEGNELIVAASGSNLYVANPIAADRITSFTLTGVSVDPTLVRSNFINDPSGMVAAGGYLFVSDEEARPFNKFDATTGAQFTRNAGTVPGNSNDIAISGNNVFVISHAIGGGSYFVSEFNATTSAQINPSLLSGTTPALNLVAGPHIAVQGNDLFVSLQGSAGTIGGNAGTIGEYDATTGAAINASFITGLNDPQGIAVYGGDLYVVVSGTGKIAEYTLSGALVNASLVSGLTNAESIAIVPEPSTWLLAVLGAAGLLLAARRQR
jgi:PEP-CTERM motif